MAIETVPAVETVKKLTPDDVWEMLQRGDLDPDWSFELDDGEIVEVPPAFGDHSSTGAKFVTAFANFAEKAGGRAFGADAGFMVGPDLKQLRAPDAGYIAPARVQPSYPRWIPGAPDIAVEVLSPDQYTDRYAKPKVREYFEAGAQLVWLVDTIKKEVRVDRPNSDEYTVYRRDAVLTLQPVIDGFALKVSDIFS